MECNANGAVKVLVANKCDLTEKRVVAAADGAELSKQHDAMYLEASAKSNVNVATLFQMCALGRYPAHFLRTGGLRLPMLNRPIPCRPD